MPKVLVTAVDFPDSCPEGMDVLRAAGCEVVVDASVRAASDADAVIVADGVFDAGSFGSLPGVKVVARMGEGGGNVSLPDAAGAGVMVVDTPGADARAVAESCLALLLTLAREVPRLSAVTKQGRWVRTVFHELPGRTLGLSGFGPAARELAGAAAAFGLERIACAAEADAAEAEKIGVKQVSFEELLRQSHYLVIADKPAGSMPTIGAAELALLPDGAFVVSAAPDAFSADAVAKTLEEGKLAGVGACLASPAADNPLFRFENFICIDSPVVTAESAARAGLAAARAVVSILSGKGDAHRIA